MKILKKIIKDKVADLTKREICESALEIIKERGFSDCTMNEIAHRAGVSVGTVYNYFENKQCLLFYLKKQLTRDMISNLSLYIEEDLPPAELLNKIIHKIFSFQNEYNFIYDVNNQRQYHDEEKKEILRNLNQTTAIVRRILNEGVAKKTFNKINTLQSARLVILSCIGITMLRMVFKEQKLPFSYQLILNNFYSLIESNGCVCEPKTPPPD